MGHQRSRAPALPALLALLLLSAAAPAQEDGRAPWIVIGPSAPAAPGHPKKKKGGDPQHEARKTAPAAATAEPMPSPPPAAEPPPPSSVAAPAPAIAPAPPEPAAAAPTAPAAAPGALDFDLLGPEAAVTPEELARREALQRSLLRRRTLLTVHQVAGLTLLAGMATTVVLGQLDYSDKYGGGGDTGKYIAAHEAAAVATSAVFAAAGLLALVAPSPSADELSLDPQPHLSTSTLHKTAMAVATAGMIAEVVLGVLSARAEGTLAQRNYALAHQINGYVMLGAITAGFTVLTF